MNGIAIIYDFTRERLFAILVLISFFGVDIMKAMAKSVDVIAWFNESGKPCPIRFRINNKDKGKQVINVDRVMLVEKELLVGNPMLVFRCQSLINKLEKVYELKFEINTCKWYLWKM